MALIKTNARGQSSNLGRRRLNPNGAMLVSQRATTKATLVNGYNCLDRVFTYKSHDGVVEESQSTDTPNSEFYNSLKHRVTTADTSIASTQYHALSFRLEGNSVTQLGFGTSGAKKVTVSFWVKSSVAGAYGAALRNLGGNRFNQATMTINSADTWEKKSITYTGDTSGTWPKDNTEGFQLQLSQAMGTAYQGTSADTWVTTVDVAPSNQVNWLATVGNTFYLTGLQFEEGDTATEFEHLSFAEELRLCKRYFTNLVGGSDAFSFPGKGQGSTTVDGIFPLAVPLRASPTMNSLAIRFFSDGGFAPTTTTPTANQFQANNDVLAINIGSFSGGASFANNEGGVWGPVSATLTIDAEL